MDIGCTDWLTCLHKIHEFLSNEENRNIIVFVCSGFFTVASGLYAFLTRKNKKDLLEEVSDAQKKIAVYEATNTNLIEELSEAQKKIAVYEATNTNLIEGLKGLGANIHLLIQASKRRPLVHQEMQGIARQWRNNTYTLWCIATGKTPDKWTLNQFILTPDTEHNKVHNNYKNPV